MEAELHFPVSAGEAPQLAWRQQMKLQSYCFCIRRHGESSEINSFVLREMATPPTWRIEPNTFRFSGRCVPLQLESSYLLGSDKDILAARAPESLGRMLGGHSLVASALWTSGIRPPPELGRSSLLSSVATCHKFGG
ncbi:hypothetical protein Salat_1739900 [Sesamum alatum]|uniref:Uncharacterized protein n=1 Tax=Sesamum alatum TaxID=300844 RepID=A0AAE1Y8R3_9LAMI|nr:hypothetical protein Salat_1739900 [Sesamum alatum]